jgi:Flp pilus assembly secretin CpaC
MNDLKEEIFARECCVMNRLHMLVVTATFLPAALLPGVGTADEMRLRVLGTESANVQPGGAPTPIGVTLDFARILAFPHPARTVVIGNPAIVDGTLSDEHTIVLTGKAIGTTNMIVLGEGGQEIANLAVSVFANSNQVTTVYSGTQQQIFSCSETCRPVPTITGK